MSTTFWVILGLVNIPLYFGLGWVLFGGWDDFLECVRFWLTPDIFSMFNGEYWEDCWGEMKLGFWALGCIGSVIVEGILINNMFGAG